MNIPSKTIITTCIFLFFATTTLGQTPTPNMTPTPAIVHNTITVDLPNLPPVAVPLRMELIQPGTFLMGSPESESPRNENEGPQHLVTITKPFYLGKYEITQHQWLSLMNENPSEFTDDLNKPVENVSWLDCQLFIEKINDLNIGTFRLPTEAEWEYACRAGTQTRFYWGDDTDLEMINDFGWHKDNSNNKTHVVGLKKPNAWNLYDMSGNVFERCLDTYYEYTPDTQIDPLFITDNNFRIRRGSSWNSDKELGLRSAYRQSDVEDIIWNNVGFRILRLTDDMTIPSPTPTPTPPNLNLLTGDTLEDNYLTAAGVSGFREGKVAVVELPDAPSADAKGLEVTLGPGQGVWIQSTDMASVSSLAQVSAVLKASDKNISFAVVALNSPIDGQIAYSNISGDEVPTSQYRTLNLFYDPPANGLQVALQVVNSPFATVSSKVWIDQFRVDTVQPIADGERVETQVDGSFEHGLEDLITNINDGDGSITPFFESLTDIALRLEIDSDQFAANIGTSLLNLEGQFPMQLLGEVNVKREMSLGNGMFAFVLTNGFQSIGLFRNIDQIPLANDQNSETIILGGDFNVANPSSPVMVFVQNGGQNAPSSIVIDDLRVIRK